MGKTLGIILFHEGPFHDIIFEIATFLGPEIDILQVGFLDEYDDDAIVRPAPSRPADAITVLLRNGQPVNIDLGYVDSMLAEKVAYVEDRGADLTIVLSTEALPVVPSRNSVIYPHRLVLAMVGASWPTGRVGVVLPRSSLRHRAQEKWGALGDRVDFAAVWPTADGSEWQRAGERLVDNEVVGIVLDDFGYSTNTGKTIAALTRCPVVCARSITARMAAELL